MTRPLSDRIARVASGAVMALTFALAASSVRAEELEGQPGAWLDRMSRAVSSLSYEGVFVYQHRGRLETMRIVHQGSENGTRSRLLSLNGTPREIIRDGDRVTCYLPDSEQVVVDHSRSKGPFPAGLDWDAEAFSEHYEFTWIGRDRISGRDCRAVAVRPKDEYRYGYRLWLDEETALPLKIDLVGEDAEKPLEQMMFTSITLRERIEPSRLEAATDGREFAWYRGEEGEAEPVTSRGAAARQWRVERAPSGFEPMRHVRRRLPSSSSPVEHIVYGDGLASVSIYIEEPSESEPDKLFQGPSRMGAVNAYGRMVDGHPVTVVGEVPQETVEMMARSVVRRAGGR